jgi:hypothetical protein
MLVFGILFLVLAIVLMFYSCHLAGEGYDGVSLFVGIMSVFIIIGGVSLIMAWTEQPHKINNVKEYSIEEKVIFVNSVPTDTTYIITYKK